MRKTIAVLGTCALAASLAVATSSASAAPGGTAFEAKTKSTMSLTFSAPSFIQGKTPVKVSATVKSAGKNAKGKVAFFDGKKKLKTVTLKGGKVSYTLPAKLSVGSHKIKATFQPKSKNVKAVSKTKSVQVFALSLQLDNSAYSVYLNNYTPIGYNARFSGVVTGPWLDFFVGGYRQGSFTGDKMKEIEDQDPSAAFASSGTYWWYASESDAGTSVPGTHAIQASFTPLISAADAVALADFTLTVASNVLGVGTAIQPGNYRLAEGPTAGGCRWRVTGSDGYSTLSGGAADIASVGAGDASLTFTDCGGGPVPA
ncbi:MAG: Ig-like domain repeat protein [Bifidobacteriaceae bacterium]|jgi:hypothetical protein|nr:Ig-like domain repeat protein [Bifidobacteriaceae bacterium]